MEAAADCPDCGHPQQWVQMIGQDGTTIVECGRCRLLWIIGVF
jgi:Zn ribbon nucleic-acid-binding protein